MKRISFYVNVPQSCRFHSSFCYVFVHERATVDLIFLCFKVATLSSASFQTFIKELKEVSLEF